MGLTGSGGTHGWTDVGGRIEKGERIKSVID